MTRYRPTVAEIDLDAIRSNVRLLKPPDAELLAVVKADGYGHGAVDVAGAALDEGATALCVATVGEALELRTALPEVRITYAPACSGAASSVREPSGSYRNSDSPNRNRRSSPSDIAPASAASDRRRPIWYIDCRGPHGLRDCDRGIIIQSIRQQRDSVSPRLDYRLS